MVTKMKTQSAEAIPGDVPVPDIPEGTRGICEEEYRACRNIVVLDIPEGVRSIGKWAFKDCTGLTAVHFPDSLEEIYDGAFENCSSLLVAELPRNLKIVGDGIFAGCGSLLSISKPRGGDYFTEHGALYSTSDNKLVMYPPGREDTEFAVRRDIEFVGKDAFRGCTHLERVFFRSRLAWVPEGIFDDCPRLKSIGCLEDGPVRFLGNTVMTSYDGKVLQRVPQGWSGFLDLEGVERIQPGAFRDCDRVEALRVSEELTFLGKKELECLKSLKYLAVPPGCSCVFETTLLNQHRAEVKTGYTAGHVYAADPMGFVQLSPETEAFVLRKFDRARSRGVPDRVGFGRFVRQAEEEETFEPVKVEGFTFDMVAGNDEAKREIYESMVLPARRPDLFETFKIKKSGGVLLYGPPGTGKTLLAKATAASVGAAFYCVHPTDILNKFVGESESLISELFDTAREQERAVIFIDDFDSLGRARHGGDREPWHNDMIAQLLVELDGMEDNGHILVMCATNRPWALDSALTRAGRLSTHIMVGLPNREARRRILEINTEGVPCAEDLNLDAIAGMTEGYNGADMAEICARAKKNRVLAIDRGDKTERLTQEDLVSALATVKSSVTQKDLDDIERYRRTGEGPDDNQGEERYVPSQRKDNSPGYY